MNLAPIVLFTYKRLHETTQTIEALKANYLAQDSELYIFSDEGKTAEDKIKVSKVRHYLETIDGFKKVTIIKASENKGLANSIISGVTTVIERHGQVIVLEDDLITTPNYLDFMNQALLFYKSYSKVVSITGFTMNLPSLPGKDDVYFGYRASSWGWGTWVDRWEMVDWEVKSYKSFIKDAKQKKRFKRAGSDHVRLLKAQMTGLIDSWAVRFCFHQFLKDQLTVFPTLSKLKSIGFSQEATHTFVSDRFKTLLDKEYKRDFEFNDSIIVDENLAREFRSKFSIKQRLTDKIKKYIR